MNYEQFASQFANVNSKNFDSIFALTEKSVERAQKLADINFAAAKSLIGEAQDNLSTLLSAKDPQALLALVQDGSFEDIGNKIYAQQQAVAKVVREAGEEAAELAEGRGRAHHVHRRRPQRQVADLSPGHGEAAGAPSDRDL